MSKVGERGDPCPGREQVQSSHIPHIGLKNQSLFFFILSLMNSIHSHVGVKKELFSRKKKKKKKRG